MIVAKVGQIEGDHPLRPFRIEVDVDDVHYTVNAVHPEGDPVWSIVEDGLAVTIPREDGGDSVTLAMRLRGDAYNVMASDGMRGSVVSFHTQDGKYASGHIKVALVEQANQVIRVLASAQETDPADVPAFITERLGDGQQQ